MSENMTSFGINQTFKYLFLSTLLVLIVWYLKYLWTIRHKYILSRKVQGPRTYPIIGCGHLFLRNPLEYMQLYKEWYAKYPGTFKFWIVNHLLYVVSEPEHIEKILSSPDAIEKMDEYQPVAEFLGAGLITAPGKIWKPHRKAMAPSFSKTILNTYVDTFVENSLKFVKQIKEVINRRDVDWILLAKRYALDAACKTTMCANLNIMHTGPRGEDLGDCIENINELGMKRFFKVWNHVGIIYKFTQLKKDFDKYNQLTHKIISSVINQKMKEFNENKKDMIAETEGKSKRKALLELLVEDPVMFTEEVLIDEAKSVLAAGTDTTGMAICSVFIMLGMFPDIQQKVYEEIIDIIGVNREVEASDIPNLQYLERVIKETMRLLPPVVFFGRKLTKDIKLGDITIPNGTGVGFPCFQVHRDPKYWKDPLSFNPDRFLPEESSKRQPCTYFPFSYGPRNCIGYQYGLYNLKTILSTVIREFKVFTEYKSVEEVEFILRPLLTLRYGVKIWFEERKP